jgi:dipeptidyl aminopeptidase/acylaminoacyl peptidase
MPRPLTPEDVVYGFTIAGEPQIAPDGARIVFTKSKVDPESKKVGSHVWMCDLDGGNMRQLTRSGTRNGGARWSPDGAQLAFVSDRVKRAGIFVMPADGLGEAREVTRHNQGISELTWSPDGTKLAYTTTWDPENPDEEDPAEGAAPKVRVTSRIDYKQDTRGYLNDLRLHVWVVDVASGERRRLSTALNDHLTPQWSPDGQWIGALQYRLNGMAAKLALLPLDAGEPRLIGADNAVAGPWSWSPDGSRVLISADPDGTPQLDFFVYELATGELRRLTDDLQVSPTAGNLMDSAPGAPIWLDERQVLFLAARAGGSGLHVIDANAGTLEPVASFEALHAGLSVDNARRYVVQAFHSAERQGEISVYDLAANTQRIITDFSSAVLSEAPSATPERITVQRGDFEVEAWLLHPPGFDPSKQYPLVIDIHGGPHGFYGYGFYPWQQVLATHGFLVVYANPRGSGSYGRKFGMAVRHDWGGEDYLDLMAVVDKVLERPYADASRTGMRGYSYGGYMTSWMLGQTDRFQACVCGAPCFDFESFWGTSDIGHYFGEIQFGDAPHKAKEAYAKHSPSEFIHNATTPTLIIHGENDQRCPIGQGEQLFISLLRAGVETEFVRYPGGDHLFLLYGPPEHRADFWRRELAWFTKHLKPEVTA